MFGFVREELGKEVKKLNDELDVLKRKQGSVKNKILAISDFQSLKFDLKSNSIEAVLYGLIYIVLITILNIMFAPIVAQFCTIYCSLILISVILNDVCKAVSAKRKLKKNFNKCLTISKIVLEDAGRLELVEKLNKKKLNYKDLNNKLLEEVSKVLISQKKIISYNIRKVEDELSSSNRVLDNIDNYQSDKKFYSKGYGLISSQADSFDECISLIKQYRKANDIAQNYFEEPASYCSLDYDYNLGYEEGPKIKQLKKKF